MSHDPIDSAPGAAPERASGADPLGAVLRRSLADLRAGTPPGGRDENLVRAMAAHERELRVAEVALRALSDPEDAPERAAHDPFTVDEEERPEALERRLAELRGKREGFAKAVALILGQDVAARLEAEARGRLVW